MYHQLPNYNFQAAFQATALRQQAAAARDMYGSLMNRPDVRELKPTPQGVWDFAKSFVNAASHHDDTFLPEWTYATAAEVQGFAWKLEGNFKLSAAPFVSERKHTHTPSDGPFTPPGQQRTHNKPISTLPLDMILEDVELDCPGFRNPVPSFIGIV